MVKCLNLKQRDGKTWGWDGRKREKWKWVLRIHFRNSRLLLQIGKLIAFLASLLDKANAEAEWYGKRNFSVLYVIKRYLAYRAEPPFAAISGTASSLGSREDSANTLYASTSVLALARGLRRAVRVKDERLVSLISVSLVDGFLRSFSKEVFEIQQRLKSLIGFRSHTHAKIV